MSERRVTDVQRQALTRIALGGFWFAGSDRVLCHRHENPQRVIKKNTLEVIMKRKWVKQTSNWELTLTNKGWDVLGFPWGHWESPSTTAWREKTLKEILQRDRQQQTMVRAS